MRVNDKLYGLWAKWQETGNAVDRDALIVACRPLVRMTVQVVLRNRPDRFDEDAYSAALLYVVSHLDGYDPKRSRVGSFVSKFARYGVAEHFRKEQPFRNGSRKARALGRTPPHLSSLEAETLKASVHEYEHPAPESSYADVLSDQSNGFEDVDARDELKAILQTLPPSLRQPTILYHIRGFGFSEIARRLRISHTAVSLRIARAMRLCREAVCEMK